MKKMVRMSDEILNKMLEINKNQSRWFFNLLDVLVQKGILNLNDLDYIRHHGEEATNDTKGTD